MYEIVVGVVCYQGKVLLLKRQETKRYDPGKWEFVSGFVDRTEDLAVLTQQKIMKETGLNAIFQKAGKVFFVNDEYGQWRIHPFLFLVASTAVVLSADHKEYRWIEPRAIRNFEGVKDLDKNLSALGITVTL